MDVDILWHIKAHEFGSEMRSAANDFARNNAVAHDLLVVIDIMQKEIQRGDPLAETALYVFPFDAGNDARDQIEWKDSFGPFLIVIDCKGHSLREECVVRQVAFFLEVLTGHPGITGEQLVIMRTDAAARLDQPGGGSLMCVAGR